MNRREFIKVMAAGSSVALLPSLLNPGEAEAREAPGVEAWNGPSPAELDIRRIVLSYAILASNPHNKQPWIVDFTGPKSFDLYVDQDRLLPETDPVFRQIHVGQGTFLENLSLAAPHFGHQANIEYFPEGMYPNDRLANKPIAAIRLSPVEATELDPLFEQILKRQTNKRNYDDRPLTAHQLIGMRGVRIGSDLAVTFSNETSLRCDIAEIVLDGMRIEVTDEARNAETLEMFRVNDAEVVQYRDGFGIAQSGVSGFSKWVAETFLLDRKDLETGSDFGDAAVEMTGEQANSADVFGWIVSDNNQRSDQVETGRAYARIGLTAASLGVAIHPFSQVLQEYPDMAELQRRLLARLNITEGHTLQMLFRLGRAAAVRHTARRPIRDLMRGRSEA